MSLYLIFDFAMKFIGPAKDELLTGLFAGSREASIYVYRGISPHFPSSFRGRDLLFNLQSGRVRGGLFGGG